MPEIQNAMEVFKVLDKSNCRKCNEATCLAFAAAVYQGSRPIADCPALDSETVARFGGMTEKPSTLEQDSREAIAALQEKIETVDLEAAAARLDGRFADGNGVNAMALLPAEVEQPSGALLHLVTRVTLEATGGRRPLATIEGSSEQYGRPIAPAVALSTLGHGGSGGPEGEGACRP